MDDHGTANVQPNPYGVLKPLQVLAVLSCNGTSLNLHNCTRLRIAGCTPQCALLGKVTDAQCASCPVRVPIMSIAEPTARQMRGLGDLVERCIWLLFLGRLDVAQALAARMGRMFGRRRKPAPQGKSSGCGCKARKDALNRAIPFNRHAH